MKFNLTFKKQVVILLNYSFNRFGRILSQIKLTCEKIYSFKATKQLTMVESGSKKNLNRI
jgi:hypothetical protein